METFTPQAIEARSRLSAATPKLVLLAKVSIVALALALLPLGTDGDALSGKLAGTSAAWAQSADDSAETESAEVETEVEEEVEEGEGEGEGGGDN
jgi:hypothetical protein